MPNLNVGLLYKFRNVSHLWDTLYVQKSPTIYILNFLLQTSINVSDNSIVMVAHSSNSIAIGTSCNVNSIAIVIFGHNSHPLHQCSFVIHSQKSIIALSLLHKYF